MEFVLVDARRVGGIRQVVVVRIKDLENMGHLDRLVDRSLVDISRVLGQEQEANPNQNYLVIHKPTDKGAIFLVTHDAFVVLEHRLKSIVQHRIDDMKGARLAVA